MTAEVLDVLANVPAWVAGVIDIVLT